MSWVFNELQKLNFTIALIARVWRFFLETMLLLHPWPNIRFNCFLAQTVRCIVNKGFCLLVFDAAHTSFSLLRIHIWGVIMLVVTDCEFVWNVTWYLCTIGIWSATRIPSQYQDHLSWDGDFHDKDKTVVKLSYLYHGDPYTGKMGSLYWDAPLKLCHITIHYDWLGQGLDMKM